MNFKKDNKGSAGVIVTIVLVVLLIAAGVFAALFVFNMDGTYESKDLYDSMGFTMEVTIDGDEFTMKGEIELYKFKEVLRDVYAQYAYSTSYDSLDAQAQAVIESAITYAISYYDTAFTDTSYDVEKSSRYITMTTSGDVYYEDGYICLDVDGKVDKLPYNRFKQQIGGKVLMETFYGDLGELQNYMDLPDEIVFKKDKIVNF